MRNLFLLCTVLLFSFGSFGVKAEIVNKIQGYSCIDYEGSFVIGTVIDSDECRQFVESSTGYSLCNEFYGDSWGIKRGSSGFGCSPNSSSLLLLVKIKAENVCISPHNFETPEGMCSDNDLSLKCFDSSIQKQFQNEQYSCQLSNPNTSLYDTVFKWSCIDNEGAAPDLGVYCEYPENGCIQGLNCSPKDTQVCDPTSTECELPAMTEAEDMPNYIPEIPLEDPDFCTRNPDLCSEPDLNITPEPNQNPSLSDTLDNSDWTEYENKINAQNELNSKHLENINHNIKNLSDNMIKQSKFNNKLGQNQLGALFAIGEGSDEGETPNSANTDCKSQIFSCEGDLIQCAILKETYFNNCPTDELSDLENSLSAITNVDNVAALVQEDTINLGEIDEKYLNNGVAASGVCPADKTLSITIFNKTASVIIPYGPLCDLVTGVAPAVIIMGWFMGIVIIGRGQIGGF